ncbi:hypothetical protein [Nocardia uniformis]|uniref:hypothetical protein n=1 Tax=Nocardia uniformis TaxID=53432 RepID=UPI001BB25BC0|nr:hypothetical protein [Nocardia uniformis]
MPVEALRTSTAVHTQLIRHRDCTPGNGDVRENCSARTQLLAEYHRHGWIFPIPEKLRTS